MEKRDIGASSFWMEESNEQMPVLMKPKRKVRVRRMEFIGWGSKPLIEFLESNGKDSSKQLSQHELTAIINGYVHKNDLLHPEKKKRVVCDAKLHSLFGKKSVPRNKIFDLLETHFAENHDSSEDEHLYSSEEQEENAMVTCKRRKVSTLGNKTNRKNQVLETPKSIFAAIVPENIKLLYLKRTLVEDLLKNTDSFEGKVVGSYIRIKSDPNDYFQKNSHQLLPVTGVRNLAEASDVGKEVFLQVPNMTNDIPIWLLSDHDFSKEECEDLHQRIKDGLLNRPTVVELEEKARILHEDITKHWLPRELAYLQNLIDRANEKGWRRELHEYLERKQQLQIPSEVSKLLLEVPKVIADELEPAATLQDFAHGSSSSPTSILRNASNVSVDSEANQTFSSHGSNAAGSIDVSLPSTVTLSDIHIGGESNRVFVNGISSIKSPDNQPTDIVQQQNGPSALARNESKEELPLVNSVMAVESQATAVKQVSQVIELSDDDEVVMDQRGQDHIIDLPDSNIWFYLDPQGAVQGPFSLLALKQWYDACYFLPGFKVWKKGQLPEHAVLLIDVLRQMFP